MKLFSNPISIFIVTAFCVVMAHGQDSSSSTSKAKFSDQLQRLKLTTNFYLGAIGFKESQDEFQQVLFSIRPKGSYLITSNFGVRGDIDVNLTNGRSQTRYQNPNFNVINIMEAVAFYEPAVFFQLTGGAINQDKYFSNRMFIADRSFPGVVLKSGWVGKNIRIQPKAQYAIPTSTSFESDRTESEALPTLTTVGLELEWTPLKWLHLDGNANHFDYNNLPSVVAFQSSRLGNSVVGTDPSESHFRYQFKGISQTYVLGLTYTGSLKQDFVFGVVDNTEAPSDRRRSQWVGTKVSLDFEDFTLSPHFSAFFAESDSTPAIYSAFDYGRNNREGQFYGLNVDLKKLGVTIKANFVDARMIEARPLQADMQIFDLALEFKNVSL